MRLPTMIASTRSLLGLQSDHIDSQVSHPSALPSEVAQARDLVSSRCPRMSGEASPRMRLSLFARGSSLSLASVVSLEHQQLRRSFERCLTIDCEHYSLVDDLLACMKTYLRCCCGQAYRVSLTQGVCIDCGCRHVAASPHHTSWRSWEGRSSSHSPSSCALKMSPGGLMKMWRFFVWGAWQRQCHRQWVEALGGKVRR